MNDTLKLFILLGRNTEKDVGDNNVNKTLSKVEKAVGEIFKDIGPND